MTKEIDQDFALQYFKSRWGAWLLQWNDSERLDLWTWKLQPAFTHAKSQDWDLVFITLGLDLDLFSDYAPLEQRISMYAALYLDTVAVMSFGNNPGMPKVLTQNEFWQRLSEHDCFQRAILIIKAGQDIFVDNFECLLFVYFGILQWLDSVKLQPNLPRSETCNRVASEVFDFVSNFSSEQVAVFNAWESTYAVAFLERYIFSCLVRLGRSERAYSLFNDPLCQSVSQAQIQQWKDSITLLDGTNDPERPAICSPENKFVKKQSLAPRVQAALVRWFSKHASLRVKFVQFLMDSSDYWPLCLLCLALMAAGVSQLFEKRSGNTRNASVVERIVEKFKRLFQLATTTTQV